MSNKFLQDYISEKCNQNQEITKIDDVEVEKDTIIVDSYPVRRDTSGSIESMLKSMQEIEELFRQLKKLGKLP